MNICWRVKYPINCQIRGCNLDNFLRHLNQPSPPVLTHYAQMRCDKRSDLATISEAPVRSPDELATDAMLMFYSLMVVLIWTWRNQVIVNISRMWKNVSFTTASCEQMAWHCLRWIHTSIYDSLKSMTRSKRNQDAGNQIRGFMKIRQKYACFSYTYLYV